MFKRVAEDSETIFRFLHFSVEFIPHMWDCLLVASRHTNRTKTMITPQINKIERCGNRGGTKVKWVATFTKSDGQEVTIEREKLSTIKEITGLVNKLGVDVYFK